MNPSPKNILRSKTFWLNLASVAAACYPPAAAWLAANPVAAVAALAAANTLMRFLTNGRVTLLPEDSTGGLAGGSDIAGKLPLWALMAGLAGGLGFFSLPACTSGATVAQLPNIPIHAQYHKGGTTVSYDSKGGLSVDQDSGK